MEKLSELLPKFISCDSIKQREILEDKIIDICSSFASKKSKLAQKYNSRDYIVEFRYATSWTFNSDADAKWIVLVGSDSRDHVGGYKFYANEVDEFNEENCVQELIQERQKINDIRKICALGGGGTSMKKAIEDVDKMKPDVILTITDGYTDWNDKPTKAKQITLLTEKGSRPKYGVVIEI